MKLLGAIIAGGQSKRFGSDKAQAIFDGIRLLDHVANAIRPHVESVIVVGRSWPGLTSVPDRPDAGLGPLGGLCGALHFASTHGYNAILTTSCDVIGLDLEMIGSLHPGLSISDSHPVIGLWPSGVVSELERWLGEGNSRSLYAFADHMGARRVVANGPLININTREDLRQAALLQLRHRNGEAQQGGEGQKRSSGS